MISGLLGSFLPYVLAGVAMLVGVLGYGMKQKRAGKNAAINKRIMEDKVDAQQVRDALDAIDRDDPAVDRLRSQGRLRDGDES